MADVDTSAEAVERLAHLLRWPGDEAPWRATCEEAADVLLAIRAERDDWRQKAVIPNISWFCWPASKMLQFEVGNRDVVGVDAAKADGSVYRMDICGIANPNAAHIAAWHPTAALALLARLERAEAALRVVKATLPHMEGREMATDSLLRLIDAYFVATEEDRTHG